MLMFVLTLLTGCFAICYGAHFSKHVAKPTWPEVFYVSGTLYLPYAEIEEPFSAWYDSKTKKSRIDMYGGMDKTLQRGDLGKYGRHYLVAPMTNEDVTNKKTCFMVEGTKEAPIRIQSLLPDLKDFEYIGMQSYREIDVMEWRLTKKNGNKVSKYTMYVHHTSKEPILYKMDGFNSLTGSHFDEYRLEYGMMSTNISQEVFDLPMKDLKCHGFPGPGYEAGVKVNPMKEYIHPVDDSHVHHMHNDFKVKYNKQYKSQKEYNQRKETFKHNLRYIHSVNRKHTSYKLKVNHLAEHTPDELKSLRGRRTTLRENRPKTGLKEFKMSNSIIPEEVNWRLYGAVTPVKDQATCGSCWSFGSTGTVEGTLFLKTGELVRLSQQNLMDCSWGFGNLACDGGEEFRSFQYMMKHGGLATEEEYGRYLGSDGFCRKNITKVADIKGYVEVPKGSIYGLKQAIAQNGPVSVGIDAAHLSFVFYSHGVYYEPKCGNKEDDLDHAVLAVGYGTIKGKSYWLVKNSWSTHWGNDGYVLMSMDNNNCGVATDASYVLM